MPINPPPILPGSQSRRAWMAKSLCLGTAWAGLRVHSSTETATLLPWDKPVPLGHSGLRVTRLGFGCEEAKDSKLIRQAADLGINHFNSFPNRGDISNFPVVGEALRPVRSRVILATGSNNRSPAGLLADLDLQLQALRTDYLDLFYLIAVSKAETLTDDLLEALNTAQQSGKIRAGALSTHGFTAILPRLLRSTGTIKALMVTCNFASWDSGGWTDALPDIRRLRIAGVGIVAMKPLMGGMGDTPPGRSALAETLKTPAGRTRVMSAALQWVLQNQLVDTVPLLIKSLEELKASTTAAADGLSDEDERLLATTVREASPRLCRLCPTCRADCRGGLPVPEIMRAAMYAEGYGNLPRARKAYADLCDGTLSAHCESCPECTADCPNGVRVRDRLLSAHAQLTRFSPNPTG